VALESVGLFYLAALWESNVLDSEVVVCVVWGSRHRNEHDDALER
jgi:hypothetical protein